MLAETALEPNFSIDIVSRKTDGMSGSDLKELCRNAAMVPVREYLKEAGGDREIFEKGQLEASVQTSL